MPIKMQPCMADGGAGQGRVCCRMTLKKLGSY